MSNLIFKNNQALNVSFLVVAEQKKPAINLDRSNSEYLLNVNGLTVYKLVKPFVPDEAWGIEQVNMVDVVSPLSDEVPKYILDKGNLLGKISVSYTHLTLPTTPYV